MKGDPLTTAAESPDPAIRELAMRRMEIDKEALRAVAPVIAAAVREKDATADVGEQPRIASEQMPVKEFVQELKALLLEAGAPLQPAALFARFQAKHPQFTEGGLALFRKRMYGLTKYVNVAHDARGQKLGWWPVNTPLPEDNV
jgi:hypothetical protein